MRARLRGRRQLRHLSGQRSGAGRCRDRRARRAAGFSDRRTDLARGAHRRRLAVAGAGHAVPAHFLSHRRRAPAERQRRWRPGKTPTAMRRRSTCSRRCRSFPASGPTRKPSSSRSMPCSRASIRSRRRSNAIPAASRSRSTRCATKSKSARGSALLRLFSPAAFSPATRSGSTCRRRSISRCLPTPTCRSS